MISCRKKYRWKEGRGQHTLLSPHSAVNVMQMEYVKGLTFTYFCTLVDSMWGCPLNHLWSFCAWLSVSPWTFSTRLKNHDTNFEKSFFGNRPWNVLEVTVYLASQSGWLELMKLHCLYFSPCSHLFPVFSSANCSCITKFMSHHRRTYPHIPARGSCSKTLSVCLPVTVHNSDSSAGVYRSFCHVLSLPVLDVFISLSLSHVLS